MKPIEDIADHKEAAQILADEYAALNWHGTTITGGHVATDAENWKHYAWTVNFAPPSKAPVSMDYKCGMAHAKRKKSGWSDPRFDIVTPIPPKAAEVLACYCRDFTDSDCAFDEWAENFGYDTDSRKALATYESCRAAGPKLRALGLTREQIARFAALSSLL